MEIQLRCEGSKGIVRSKVYDPVNEPVPVTERKAGALLSFLDGTAAD